MRAMRLRSGGVVRGELLVTGNLLWVLGAVCRGLRSRQIVIGTSDVSLTFSHCVLRVKMRKATQQMFRDVRRSLEPRWQPLRRMLRRDPDAGGRRAFDLQSKSALFRICQD
jgi:hypothetical protein